MKKILTSALAGLTLAGLVGCSSSRQEVLIRNMPEANGYDVSVEKEISGNGYTKITIGRYREHSSTEGLLIGEDFGNDGRIDKITLHAIPQNGKLEEMTDVRKLDDILRVASKQLK